MEGVYWKSTFKSCCRVNTNFMRFQHWRQVDTYPGPFGTLVYCLCKVPKVDVPIKKAEYCIKLGKGEYLQSSLRCHLQACHKALCHPNKCNTNTTHKPASRKPETLREGTGKKKKKGGIICFSSPSLEISVHLLIPLSPSSVPAVLCRVLHSCDAAACSSFLFEANGAQLHQFSSDWRFRRRTRPRKVRLTRVPGRNAVKKWKNPDNRARTALERAGKDEPRAVCACVCV